MGNYAKKKTDANVHNKTLELYNDCLFIGSCQCGGNLFMYLKSNSENVFNYYCDGDNDLCGSIGDIRNPKTGDIIYGGVVDVANHIKSHYEKLNISLDETIESKANLNHGMPKIT